MTPLTPQLEGMGPEVLSEPGERLPWPGKPSSFLPAFPYSPRPSCCLGSQHSGGCCLQGCGWARVGARFLPITRKSGRDSEDTGGETEAGPLGSMKMRSWGTHIPTHLSVLSCSLEGADGEPLAGEVLPTYAHHQGGKRGRGREPWT